MKNIHSTAIVSPKAELGDNVCIGPYSVVREDVKIGSNTVIGPHVCIYPYTSIGQECEIHDNAVVGDVPQDLAFKNIKSYVQIGLNCVIREGVTIHRGTKPETVTTVGNSCYLMVNSHVAHNVTLGNNVILVNGALLGGYVEVGERAFISGNCGVHQFVKIGMVAMLGGHSILTVDLPPFCSIATLEYNRVFGLNVVGMRRAGLTPDQRSEIRKAFDLLYKSGITFTRAREELKKRFPSGPAAEFWKFLDRSERGICKFAKSKNKRGNENVRS